MVLSNRCTTSSFVYYDDVSSSDEFMPNIDDRDSSDEFVSNTDDQDSDDESVSDTDDQVTNDVSVPNSDAEGSTSRNMEVSAHLENDVPTVSENVESATQNQLRKKKIFMPKDNFSRKRKRAPSTWKKQSAAIAREKGKEYLSYNGRKMPAKSPHEGVICKENCKLKCNQKFDRNQRASILEAYYNMDVNAKNCLLFKSIDIKLVARHRKNAKSHKSFSYRYNITVNSQVIQVCKTAICNLYQISRKKIDIIQKKLSKGSAAPSPDSRGHHNNRPHKLPEEVVEFIIQHINRFPADISHYSRHNNPNKKYLSPLLNITKMYDLYILHCNEEKKDKMFYVKKCSYSDIF